MNRCQQVKGRSPVPPQWAGPGWSGAEGAEEGQAGDCPGPTAALCPAEGPGLAARLSSRTGHLCGAPPCGGLAPAGGAHSGSDGDGGAWGEGRGFLGLCQPGVPALPMTWLPTVSSQQVPEGAWRRGPGLL